MGEPLTLNLQVFLKPLQDLEPLFLEIGRLEQLIESMEL